MVDLAAPRVGHRPCQSGVNDPVNFPVYRVKVLGHPHADATTYTDDTVEPENWYDYTVRATNAAGNSAEGGMETIKTKVQTEEAPPAPEDTEADQ